MHTHASSTLHNPVTLTFDLMVNACRGPVIECMCKFGVDSSSCFSFRAWRGLTELMFIYNVMITAIAGGEVLAWLSV